MNTDFAVFLALYLAGLVTRTSYELLKKAGRVIPEGRILFAIVLVAMLILWVSWFRMCPLDPWRINLPPTFRWIGLGLLIVGWGLALGALIQLRGVENIKHLVTTGLFSWLRHPMYTGFILWILGWATYHGAVVSSFFGLLGIGNILFWQRLEEEKLESQYGADYREYQEKTWF